MPRSALREALFNLLLALLFTLVGRLGLAQIVSGEWPWLIVWPPTGFAIAIVLMTGFRFLPGILVGAFAAPVSAGLSIGMGVSDCLGALTQAVLSWFVVKKTSGLRFGLASLRELLKFVAVVGFGITLAAAGISVIGHVLAGLVATDDLLIHWLERWWGDILSVLLFAPFVISWWPPHPDRWSMARRLEFAGLMGISLLSLQLVFGVMPQSVAIQPVLFVLFPFVVWTALHFGQRGASLLVALCGVFVIWGTARGAGPFAMLPMREEYFLLEAFLLVLGVTGLILAAVMADRKRAEGTLEQAILRHESILHSMAEGLLLLDDDDRVAQANQSAERILRKPVRQILGKACRDVLGEGCPRQDAQDVLLDYAVARGLRQIRCNRVSLGGSGAILTFRDTTQEEEISRLKSDFVSLTSHELRTPLSIIKGYLDILVLAEEMGVGPERQTEILTRVRSQTNRLVQMVEDLLNVAKLEEGRVIPNLHATQVVQVVTKVIQELQPLADAKGIAIHLNVPVKSLPEVQADPQMLGHIIGNLLDNAIKYSINTHPIEVALAQTGDFVRMTVADRGVGIPHGDLSQVFQKFHRVPNALMLRERGTGLGLFSARKMAELQHGMLVVSSIPESGTTFALTLPVAIPAELPVRGGERRRL